MRAYREMEPPNAMKFPQQIVASIQLAVGATVLFAILASCKNSREDTTPLETLALKLNAKQPVKSSDFLSPARAIEEDLRSDSIKPAHFEKNLTAAMHVIAAPPIDGEAYSDEELGARIQIARMLRYILFDNDCSPGQRNTAVTILFKIAHVFL